MARLREWWDFLFGSGQPPTDYDRADAWVQVGCLVGAVLVVALVAIGTYLIFR